MRRIGNNPSIEKPVYSFLCGISHLNADHQPQTANFLNGPAPLGHLFQLTDRITTQQIHFGDQLFLFDNIEDFQREPAC